MLWNVSWGLVQVFPSTITFLYIESRFQVHRGDNYAVSSQLRIQESPQPLRFRMECV